MYRRYAIYYTATGPFAEKGASWLGWDVAQGRYVSHPKDIGLDLPDVTETPRKYGFHGTLKAPFQLAEGADEAGLLAALQPFCITHAPAAVAGLEVVTLGRFLAFVPRGDTTPLNQLAADIVRDFDVFRAPLTTAELARGRKANLSPRQEEHLTTWGYPHVLDQFRFHMTLSARMPKADLSAVADAADAHFGETLPQPFGIDALTLAGERDDGFFESLQRLPLTG